MATAGHQCNGSSRKSSNSITTGETALATGLKANRKGILRQKNYLTSNSLSNGVAERGLKYPQLDLGLTSDPPASESESYTCGARYSKTQPPENYAK